MSTTAIFDANYMARRAYFARAKKAADVPKDLVVFGFLVDVAAVLKLLDATTAAFCFDAGESKRREVFPNYKCSRVTKYKKMNAAERKAENEYYRQLEKIPYYLEQIGYANIFQQPGYEADDLMAECCNGFPGRKFLISSDKDLFQLLTSQVSCWNPQQKKMTSVTSFYRTWGISPADWVEVKAIAGCKTDDVAGVFGVGEATAAKFIRKELTTDSIAYRSILKAEPRIEKNIQLVRLPFPGTQACEPQGADFPHEDGWRSVSKKLRVPDLSTLLPGARRERVLRDGM
jgi:DNA polymerase-1